MSLTPRDTTMEQQKEQGKVGLSLARHSLTSFSKRRPFSRKPSSWRHPGGTVSETEETDFSECEETAEATEPELGRRKPSHVHSFTFSSLSMFRSKQQQGTADTGAKVSSCRHSLVDGNNHCRRTGAGAPRCWSVSSASTVAPRRRPAWPSAGPLPR